MAKQINKVVLRGIGVVILVLVLGSFLPPPSPPQLLFLDVCVSCMGRYEGKTAIQQRHVPPL